MGDPCLLHTMLYAGASYQLFLGCQHESLRQIRMTSYRDSLASLRLAVNQADACISDAMLLSIAMLSLIGSTDLPIRIARSTDPMYRDNEFYTNGGWEPAHVKALLMLTKQRGGTKAIELHNLAEMIMGYGFSKTIEIALINSLGLTRTMRCAISESRYLLLWFPLIRHCTLFVATGIQSRSTNTPLSRTFSTFCQTLSLSGLYQMWCRKSEHFLQHMT